MNPTTRLEHDMTSNFHITLTLLFLWQSTANFDHAVTVLGKILPTINCNNEIFVKPNWNDDNSGALLDGIQTAKSCLSLIPNPKRSFMTQKPFETFLSSRQQIMNHVSTAASVTFPTVRHSLTCLCTRRQTPFLKSAHRMRPRRRAATC